MLARIFIAITIVLGIIILSGVLKEGAFINNVPRYPKKTLGVVIDIDQRDKFFEQLERFADIHRFDIHIRSTTPAGDTFSIYMSRKDVVVWGDNVLNPRGFDISFYDKDPSNPASEEVINDLLEDLQRYISEVPNIRIFETE
jgi:hypothetical protein